MQETLSRWRRILGSVRIGRPRGGPGFHAQERIAAYGFMLPSLLFICIVLLGPMIWGFSLSFQTWDLAYGRPPVYVGLKEYKDVLRFRGFWAAWIVTFKIQFLAMVTEFAFGTILALLIERVLHGRRRNLVVTLLLLPMQISGVVAGMQWRYLYTIDYGLINYFLSLVGLPKVAWLSNASTVMPAVALVQVWGSTASVMLFVLAGLQAIPVELYESASIDGASVLQQHRYITFPLLRRVYLVLLLTMSIAAIRLFGSVYTLTGGGPAGRTLTIAYFAYREMFWLWHIGTAAAVAVVMTIAAAVLGVFYLMLMRKEERVW